jgi:hypothetical protein
MLCHRPFGVGIRITPAVSDRIGSVPGSPRLLAAGEFGSSIAGLQQELFRERNSISVRPLPCGGRERTGIMGQGRPKSIALIGMDDHDLLQLTAMLLQESGFDTVECEAQSTPGRTAAVAVNPNTGGSTMARGRPHPPTNPIAGTATPATVYPRKLWSCPGRPGA